MIECDVPRRLRWVVAAAWLSLPWFDAVAASGCQDEARRGVARLSHSGSAEAVATAVVDGDTFVSTIDGAARRIRLARIDAPEKRQAYGHRAEQALRELVWKRTVQISWARLDRNCRPIAEVRVDGVDVSEAMVRKGMAWQYTAYSQTPGLTAIEQQARNGHVGLWSDPNPIPPWEWRRTHDKL